MRTAARRLGMLIGTLALLLGLGATTAAADTSETTTRGDGCCGGLFLFLDLDLDLDLHLGGFLHHHHDHDDDCPDGDHG
ncbi:hypothetical protein [Actinokineospora sp.]|uniref:hypothetical protein n=1 Tax=Actinokineospora sp. TaxID=1872133 RepID=UPI00403771D9